MQVRLSGERARESDKIHVLVNRDMPLGGAEPEWFPISDSRRGWWGWSGKVRDLKLDGNYTIEVTLSKSEVATLVRTAWGKKTFDEFITAFADTGDQ